MQTMIYLTICVRYDTLGRLLLTVYLNMIMEHTSMKMADKRPWGLPRGTPNVANDREQMNT